MRPRSIILLVLAIVVVAAGAFAVIRLSEDDAPPMEFGLQDDRALLRQEYYARDVALDQARRLNVSRLRVGVNWAGVVEEDAEQEEAPSEVEYDWSAHDALIDAARQRGMRVSLALHGPAPAWATGNEEIGPNQPDAEGFGDLARAAARHFRGKVTHYSIWNEPNWRSWLEPLDQMPRMYRQLYRAGYEAIKEADPAAQVLIGETSPTEVEGTSIPPLRFLREVLCLDRNYQPDPERECEALESDGYAHHAYDYETDPRKSEGEPDEVTIGTLDRLTGALDRVAEAGVLQTPEGDALDIHVTEFGYFATGKRALPDETRASYLRAAFEIAADNPRVRLMTHYQLIEPATGSPGRFFNTGLITTEGIESKAFGALEEWSKQALEDGRIVAPGEGVPSAPD